MRCFTGDIPVLANQLYAVKTLEKEKYEEKNNIQYWVLFGFPTVSTNNIHHYENYSLTASSGVGVQVLVHWHVIIWFGLCTGGVFFFSVTLNCLADPQ